MHSVHMDVCMMCSCVEACVHVLYTAHTYCVPGKFPHLGDWQSFRPQKRAKDSTITNECQITTPPVLTTLGDDLWSFWCHIFLTSVKAFWAPSLQKSMGCINHAKPKQGTAHFFYYCFLLSFFIGAYNMHFGACNWLVKADPPPRDWFFSDWLTGFFGRNPLPRQKKTIKVTRRWRWRSIFGHFCHVCGLRSIFI